MDEERHITTDEAVIKTASVEIRILTINGKQMTLAVFRQIKTASWKSLRDVFDKGEYAAAWGTINYCSKDCTRLFEGNDTEGRRYMQEHWHVVWQLYSELRHTTVSWWEAKGYTDILRALDQLFIAV